jgi:Protein of unknown function (DUF1697)
MASLWHHLWHHVNPIYVPSRRQPIGLMAECGDADPHRLLRGINVGGRNRVAMADLRQVVLDLGHTDVATYIQSGNVVFTSKKADTATKRAGHPTDPSRWFPSCRDGWHSPQLGNREQAAGPV